MSHKRICVTIDGPSASGKSTVAKLVANKMGFVHLDTGAIYRSIAKWCLDQKVDIADENAILEALKAFKYKFLIQEGVAKHFINDVDVTEEIRAPEISQFSSKIAAFGKVRLFSNDIQREIAKEQDVIVDARDAGTVVFPEADIKIFLTAKRKERAKRRLKELTKRGVKGVTLEGVLLEMEERDERDRQRESAPLKRAIDAIAIDTTHLSIKRITKKVEFIVRQAQPREPSRFWSFMIGRGKANASLLYKFLYCITFLIFRLLYRMRVYGVENIPQGSAIIAPNHISFLDPPIVGYACPNQLYSLAHEYLFKAPLIGKVLPKIGVLPVNGSVQDASSLRQVAAFLMKGKQVLIFPEGSRSLNGEIQPLKRGVALLASIANCPIVPTIIEGAYQIWPRRQKFPRPWGHVAVIFGEPLYWEEFESKASSKKEAQVLMTRALEEKFIEMQSAFRELQARKKEMN